MRLPSRRSVGATFGCSRFSILVPLHLIAVVDLLDPLHNDPVVHVSPFLMTKEFPSSFPTTISRWCATSSETT